MSDSETITKDSAKTLGQGSKLLVDIGPAAIFMITYNIAGRFSDSAIYWATGVFMVATAVALAWAIVVQKRTPPMLIVTFVIVTLFGGMTIYLQDPIFAYIKPTIINLIFAFAILISFAFGFNVWKALFGSIFEMPERAWFILGVRWALFFMLLALLNEVLWRHITDTVVSEQARWIDGFEISEAFWANFRFWGTYPIFFLFVLANIPLTLKYAQATGEGEDTREGEKTEG